MKLRHTIFNSIGLAIAGIVGVMLVLTLFSVVSGHSYAAQNRSIATLFWMGIELAIVVCLGGCGLSNLVSDKLKPKATTVMIVAYCLTCFLLPVGIWGIIELWQNREGMRRKQSRGDVFTSGKSSFKSRPASAHRAANISWISAIGGFVVAVICGSTHVDNIAFLGAATATLGMFVSLAYGIYALLCIREHGKQQILIPALIGTMVSGFFLLCIVAALTMGFIEGAAELKQKHPGAMQKGLDQTNDASHLQ